MECQPAKQAADDPAGDQSDADLPEDVVEQPVAEPRLVRTSGHGRQRNGEIDEREGQAII